MPKFRSPNYPAISLKDAVERVERLFAEARQSAVSEETAAKAIGYSGLTGPSRGTLSALKKYGLLVDASGGVRVSPLAMGIIRATSDDERAQNLTKAALQPPLFKRFHAEFDDVSDQILRAHLVREGFSDDGATKAIRAFRQTAQFANLSQAQAILDDTEDDDSEEIEPEVTTSTTPATRPRRDPPPSDPTEAPAFRVPLPKGRSAELRVSGGRFTKADLALLRRWLEVAEMTVEDDPSADEDKRPDWETNPTPSVVVGRGVVEANTGPESPQLGD